MKGIIYAFSVEHLPYSRSDVEQFTEAECEKIYNEHLEDNELYEDRNTGLEYTAVDKIAMEDVQDWCNNEFVNSYWIRVF